MTEAELIEAAKEIAKRIKETDQFASCEYVEEKGELEGEPASILIEMGDQMFALGVLPA